MFSPAAMGRAVLDAGEKVRVATWRSRRTGKELHSPRCAGDARTNAPRQRVTA